MSSEIPSKFTGQAAMVQQDEANWDLKEYSYTPRKFLDDDVIIKIECCGICGVSRVEPPSPPPLGG